MSMAKRYFTSAFSSRTSATFTSFVGINSTLAVRFFSAQKSNFDPRGDSLGEGARLELAHGSAVGEPFGGAPAWTRCASWRYDLTPA
jgi:hypothetical protein